MNKTVRLTQCPHCPRLCRNRSGLTRHINTAHLRSQQFTQLTPVESLSAPELDLLAGVPSDLHADLQALQTNSSPSSSSLSSAERPPKRRQCLLSKRGPLVI